MSSRIVVRSFPPIADRSARILILGSMPGVVSLAANQYYAHPQNAFWRIMGTLLEFSPASPYAQRVRALRKSGIALWDVLEACVRPGSLDRAIRGGSRVPNDFRSFFDRHSLIERVCFNGAEAETSFLALGRPQFADHDVRYLRLPSTSPAHTLPFEEKLASWRAGILRAK